MKVYVTLDVDGEPKKAQWGMGDAFLAYREVEMEPLWTSVQRYFHKRSLKVPTPEQAMLFLVSELGELADAMVHQAGGWTRNNERERLVGPEAGDVLMMLVVAMQELGIDPIEAMYKKFKEKGFDQSDL